MENIDCVKTRQLVGSIVTQFTARANAVAGLSLHIEYDNADYNKKILIHFIKGDEKHTVEVPLPFEQNGVTFIQQHDVLRAVCPYWIESEQVEVDYFSILHHIILNVPVWSASSADKTETSFLKKMLNSFQYNNTSIIAYRFQRTINEIISYMPLHETDLNSFIMNRRLMIVDEIFEALKSPEEKLEYQVSKSRKYFNVGWLSLGMSDGNLASKNYLIKGDVRKLSPFGLRFHNPQRNLYQTLGMKGDELPNVRSKSMQDLMDMGVTRTGWNMFTAFVDIPDVFEDQIMVDISHKDKFVTYSRRIQLFGAVSVKEGEKLKVGQLIGTAPDGEGKYFDLDCDSATVTKISRSITAVGGVATSVINLIIKYTRNFRDGLKLTNLHGNKGVIRLKELGYAVDPRTGEQRKIDVIVGGKTIGKRKNYGQIIEALTNCMMETDNTKEKLAIFEDDWYQPIESICEKLVEKGYNKDCTMECHTYVGKVNAVCGTVFWGCIKTPEDQIWKNNDTSVCNVKGIRIAGLKFSHIEFRAMQTRFGEQNPILDEIMSYAQGSKNLNELLTILNSRRGIFPAGKEVLTINMVKPIDQHLGTIVPGNHIGGTVVDEYFMPDGFVLKLPLPFQTIINAKHEIVHEGFAQDVAQMSINTDNPIMDVFTTDSIYIPSGILRKCWRHDSCNYGLSDIGVWINNVIEMSHRLTADSQNTVNYRLYYGMIATLFSSIAKMMCTKKGEIATCGMAVRYPYSAKATATLSTSLPKNTIEIHRSMSEQLNVHNGDVVLVERFPCLGFMSLRPQKIRITDDPMCKYTIRASSNSLVSLNLDFDGDTLFIASFHTPESKETLLREWTNPNQTCYNEIQALNERKGAPHIKSYGVYDYCVSRFEDMTEDQYASIVEKNTGVKAQTGPIMAFAYNIMRIVENSNISKDLKTRVAIEMFLERVAQSVFEQKHGPKSLYEVVIDSVCTGDVETLTAIGFKRGTSEKLCALIAERAQSIGVTDLLKFHEQAKKGGSKIVNAIVRKQNFIYFVSRASVTDVVLLKMLEAPATDVPSYMWKWIISYNGDGACTEFDKHKQDKILNTVKSDDYRTLAAMFCDVIDGLIVGQENKKPSTINAVVADTMGGVSI
mgnify:FL=1